MRWRYKKIIFKSGLFLILLFILLALILSQGPVYEKKDLVYGVTFSKKKAAELGFDWQKMYLAVLDDLGVKRLRLPAYWNDIEYQNNYYRWADLDWQLNEAKKRGVKVILAIGGRLPRWPECHFPAWAQDYPRARREERILAYLKKTVERYQSNPAIVAWQIENEPFLAHFGDCPTLDKHFLDLEIGLVRSLDKRPIVITDSGELSFWIPAARRADIFGTTMYRDTYSAHLRHYIHYPIGPGFFQFKRHLAQIFAHPKEWIVIELQAEPWGPIPWEKMTAQERARTMDLAKFRQILEFARLAGFRKFYLWGVEWWYWEKEHNHNPAMWQAAKQLFRQ